MLINWTILLAVEEAAEKGGLFDFDATLPLMALQIVILVLVLNAIFYKPIGKAIDDRDEYIRQTTLSAQERLVKSEALAKQYEQELAASRKEAQNVIAHAQAEAQKVSAQTIAEAQSQAQTQREQAAKEIEEQKQAAFQSLEQEVDALSREILVKLLGT